MNVPGSFLIPPLYQEEHNRIHKKIEYLLSSAHGNSPAEFVLGQCYALVKELKRHEDAVKIYESKKKSFEELLRRQKPTGS